MDARVEERRAAVAALAKELSEFKLYVAEKYASIAHLQEVEQRLVDQLAEMNRNLAELNKSVARLFGARERDGHRPPGGGDWG